MESDEQAQGDRTEERCTAATEADDKTHTACGKKKRKGKVGLGKGKEKEGRAAAVYHNCVAIARWMKLKAKAPEVDPPAETKRREQAVSAIARGWREQIRRGAVHLAWASGAPRHGLHRRLQQHTKKFE